MEQMQSTISVLKQLLLKDQMGKEEIERVIDLLETAKVLLGPDDDEIIDKMDELQDYFDYLLLQDIPFDMLEIKREVTALLETLEQ